MRRKSIPAACVTSTNNGGFVAGVFAPGFCAAAKGFAAAPLFFGAVLFGAVFFCAAVVGPIPDKIQLPLSVISRTVAATVLLMTLSGSWILSGIGPTTAAQKNTAPNSTAPKNKGAAAKPLAAAQKPGAKTPATNPPLFVDVTHAAG